MQTSHPSSESPSGSASEVSGKASPWSKRWLLVAIAVAAVALAYGVGRLQGALALKTVEEQHATDRGAWQATLTAYEVERDLLAARRSLSLVALSLDRRNFGVAESHRRDALQALERPSLRAVAEVTPLASTVRALDLGVDPDPGAKREQVIAVTEGLDRLVTARAKTATTAGAASPASSAPSVQ